MVKCHYRNYGSRTVYKLLQITSGPKMIKGFDSNLFYGFLIAFYCLRRRRNRILLQQQIKERDDNHRKYMTSRYKESEFAINYDKACLYQDAEDRSSKHTYLKQFRDENKKVFFSLQFQNMARPINRL
jgi:hypothetical protein